MTPIQDPNNVKTELDSKLKLFPASKPGELFVSRVSRYHWQIGGRHTEDTCIDLFGSEPGRLTQIVPTHLWPLADRLPGDATENLHSLLKLNTLYPLYALIYGCDLINPESKSASLSRIPRRTVGALDTKLCIACVKADFSGYGTPYIHRSHQVPGVRLCHKHAIALIERCTYCSCPFEVKGDLFSVPWQACQCGRMVLDSSSDEQPVASEDPALAYAQFAHGLLEIVDKQVTQEDIAETYRGRLKQLGFCRGGTVAREATIQALEAHYGAAEIEHMDIAYRTGQRNHWLRHVSRKVSTQEVPISRHLLLAAFLFSSAMDFVAALSEAQERLKLRPLATPGVRKNIQSATTSQPTDPHTTKYLSTLTAAIVENPDCTIETLWVRFPGTLKRLLKRDSVAFEIFRDGLQSKTRTPEKASPRTEARDARDQENAELLRQAATRLYASNSRPLRISRSEILRAAGLRPGDGHAKWFPLSAQVLNEYVDSTWYFWARRYIWSIVQLGQTAGSAELRAHSGLLSYNFRELVPFFSKLNVPKALKTGQLTAVLTHHGIDRNWDGPCPDREVKKAGRAYQRASAAADMPTNRMPESGKHWVKKGAAELKEPFTQPTMRSSRLGN